MAMATLYKLTNKSWMSGHGYTPLKWGPGITHTASGDGDVNGPGWLHAYTSPEAAAALSAPTTVLWRAKGDIGITDRGIQVGTARLTTLEIIPLPVFTTEARARFAILCALQVCAEPVFVKWAENWLSGVDRDQAAGMKVWQELDVAAHESAALRAAVRATWAAENASWAALVCPKASPALATEVALRAWRLAAQAVYSATRARPLDLNSLAREAMA